MWRGDLGCVVPGVLVALALAGAPCAGVAQGRVVVWAAGPTAPTGRAELWAHRVARGLEREGWTVSESVEEWARLPSGTARSRVEGVAAVEAAIEEARARAANLDEAGALVRLSAAEGRIRGALDVPGAVAWLVEVELELATLAHQVGAAALAQACLARAAALAPDRRLRAAEAPPDLVALHDVEREARRGAPLTSATVDATGVPGARVYLDDVAVGAAPVRLEARAGLHAVRVEAPGHVPWARLVELPPGRRPPIEVVLAPERAVTAAREAHALAQRLDLDAIPERLARIARQGVEGTALVLVIAGHGVLDRAAALVCDASGCRAPVRLEGTEAARLAALEAEDPASPASMRALADWLDAALPEDVPLPPPTEWWTEWWPWATVGAVAAGALAVGLGVGLYEPPPAGVVIRVTVDRP